MVESLEKDKDIDRDKEKNKDKDKYREKEKEKDKSRDKERESRDKDRDKEREKDRKHKSRSKEERDDKSRSEREREKEHRDRSKDKDSKDNKDKDRDRKEHKDKGEHKEKEHRDRDKDKDKDRDRERDRERGRDKEKDKDREREKERDRGKDKSHEKEQRSDNVAVEEEGEFNSGGAAEISLSIEETNALRAKLGIAPLKIDSGPSAEEVAKLREEREELEKEMKTIELADKIEKLKNKRLLTAKIVGKSIAEEAEGEDDDPLAWIEKSRKLETEKAIAAQRAQMMDELDEEQEEVAEKLPVYSEKNLSGLKITHNADQFGENEEILVLKDQFIVGDDGLNEGEDELESVHISEATRRKKNADAAKKKPLYDVYGDTGEKQELLPQYNDEKKDEGIKLGAGGEIDIIQKQQLEEVRKKLQAVKQESYDLEAPAHLKPMADYYTTEEMTQFKRPERRRKKKSSRKKENLADIIAATVPLGGSASNDHGSRATRAEGVLEQKIKQEKETRAQNYEKALARASEESKVLYSADVDDDEDFYSTLAQAKKAPALENVAAAVAAAAARRRTEEASSAEPVTVIEYDEDDEESKLSKGPLVISTTSEFVRNIHIEPDEKPATVLKAEGIASSHTTSALKTIKEEKTKLDDELMEEVVKEPKEEEEEDSDTEASSANPLATNEPLVSGSLAATLQFLKQRGSSMPFEAYAGRTNDKIIAPKDDPAPHIRLEYLDEHGRPMTTKEAFRAQSYKFHGKKPGKNNQEKRQKRLEMDKKRLAASTTDTPLGAVHALQSAQQKTGSAYIVLQTGSMSLAAKTAEGTVEPGSGGGKRKNQAAAGSDKRAKK